MAKSTKSSAPAPARNNNRQYLIIGGIALVVVAAFVFLSRGGGQASTQPLTTALDPAAVQNAQGVAMGNDAAPVLLYEFADFQCPACANFSTFTHPLIKERLVDQGIVKLIRYDFPLVLNHPHAFFAARAARCADEQSKFWEYHDVLYGRQPTWSPMRNPAGEFEAYAELLGMDTAAFGECLNSDRHAEEVTKNLRLGESLGVSGTPTLILNNERINVSDYTELEERVMQAAGRPAVTPDA